MASKTLQKVGLVFQADGTVDFKKSLKDINNELSANYQQLKLTQSQYDKNTTITQKLKDSYSSLEKAIELQKQKVSVLNEELKSLENSETKDEQAIQKKKKALTEAEIKLNSYRNSLSRTSEELKESTSLVNKFTDAATKTSKNIEKVGKVTSVAGAGIAAAGAVAVNSMNKVDEGLDVIVQKTGASGESLDDLNGVFKSVAKTIPSSFEDIGAAIGEINTRLDFTGEELEACAEDFLKFAKVNGTDVNTSVQLVTRAMGDAGIEASEYSSLLDMLTVAGQKSGISIDSLTTNLAKYGAPMRALGIDTKNAIAMFAGWEKAGVNTEIAFSGMKKAISTWGSQGKDATKEFSKTLEEIKRCPDIATATTKSIEVFGAKAGPDLADAIQAGRFSFEEYVSALENSSGIIESTYGNLVDEVDDTQLAHQNLDLALHGIGENISKFIGPILLNLSNHFSKLMEKFDNLSPKTKDMIMKIGTFIVVAGPLLILLAKAISGFTGVVNGVKSMSTAFKATKGVISNVSKLLNAKVLIIGLIIAAVILLVSSIVKNWDKIKQKTQELWNKFLEFKDNIVGIFQGIDDFITNIFTTDFSESFGILGNIVNGFLVPFRENYESVKQILSGFIDLIAGVFTGDWERAWNGVKNIFAGIFNGFLAIAKAPLNGIIGFLNLIIDGLNFLIRGINKISFDVPDWVPGIGGKKLGFNINEIGKINYMAKGGDLLRGSAVIAEAGPEMLFQQGNQTKVVPLSNSSKIRTDIIDYEKMYRMFVKALSSCKMKLDKEGFIRFINEQIWEAVKDV